MFKADQGQCCAKMQIPPTPFLCGPHSHPERLLPRPGFLDREDFFLFLPLEVVSFLQEKEGRGLDLSSGLVVTSLCKSTSMPASQNNLRH